MRLSGPAAWKSARDRDGLIRQAPEISITGRTGKLGADIAGLQELVTYGLKGAAAYADHAQILGTEDASLYASFHEVLNALHEGKADRGRAPRLGAQGRRDQLQGDGAPRRRQHRGLRPPPRRRRCA